MDASLVMFKSDGQRKDFPLRKAVTVVGRKSTCDLRIPLSSVSRQHFKLQQENGKIMLRDLGSSNGTFYNGQRVLEAELKAGDQVRVGPVTFTVVVDGKPADIEPVRTVLGAEPTSGDTATPPPRPQPHAAQQLTAEDSSDRIPSLGDIDEENEEAAMAALEALNEGDLDDSEASGILLLDDDDDSDKTAPKTTPKTKT
jgi:pSer/pThr/pTyr-binding forkhead associated (FHA) protein